MGMFQQCVRGVACAIATMKSLLLLPYVQAHPLASLLTTSVRPRGQDFIRNKVTARDKILHDQAMDIFLARVATVEAQVGRKILC